MTKGQCGFANEGLLTGLPRSTMKTCKKVSVFGYTDCFNDLRAIQTNPSDRSLFPLPIYQGIRIELFRYLCCGAPSGQRGLRDRTDRQAKYSRYSDISHERHLANLRDRCRVFLAMSNSCGTERGLGVSQRPQEW